MRTQCLLLGRPIAIEVTDRAQQALRARQQPLLVELELYFSCLLRKKLRFHDGGPGDVAVTDKLLLKFRPVMTQACGIDYEGDEPPVTDFPIARPEPFVPRWLRLDFADGEWRGDFGYHNRG